jgi:hypothetical protein
MAGRNYGTDPYGIIARGDPSVNERPSLSVGRVGNSMRDLSGRSVGSGVGATVRVPIKTVSKAKGGAAKKSGCDVKAYGDMIKKAANAKPVKKAKGGAGKVRKGMMSPTGKILQAVKPKKDGM